MDTSTPTDDLPAGPAGQAAAWFLRRRQAVPDVQEQVAFETWLAASPDHAQAWEDTVRTWQSFDEHAMLPELVVAREQALAAVRRTQVGRWARPAEDGRPGSRFRLLASLGAAASVLMVAGLLWWQVFPRGEIYTTGIGEQRTVLLPDDSNMVLDAVTRVRVRYDDDQRRIEMIEGQAQFEVAQDPGRPFRVAAGGRTVEALGTTFTVTYIDRRMQVALIEGRVKVNEEGPAPRSGIVEVVLAPGDALNIDADGRRALKEGADPATMNAWRQGKVIFEQEPLRDAVERLNRYSRVRLKVSDPDVGQWPVSGIFGVGDAEAFAEAIESYFPIEARREADGSIALRRSR